MHILYVLIHLKRITHALAPQSRQTAFARAHVCLFNQVEKSGVYMCVCVQFFGKKRFACTSKRANKTVEPVSSSQLHVFLGRRACTRLQMREDRRPSIQINAIVKQQQRYGRS